MLYFYNIKIKYLKTALITVKDNEILHGKLEAWQFKRINPLKCDDRLLFRQKSEIVEIIISTTIDTERLADYYLHTCEVRSAVATGGGRGWTWGRSGLPASCPANQLAGTELQLSLRSDRAALGVCIWASEEKFWQGDLRAASVSGSSSAFSLCGVFPQRVTACTILGSVLRLYGPTPPARSPARTN